MIDEDRFWFDRAVAELADDTRRKGMDRSAHRMSAETIPSSTQRRQDGQVSPSVQQRHHLDDEIRITRETGGDVRMGTGSPTAPSPQQPNPRERSQHRHTEHDESPRFYRRPRFIRPGRG